MTPEIVVVSGLPRSGTSMMMQMLEAGGLPAATDGRRPPDEFNPRGYYELDAVKRLREDAAWLADLRGRAVKVVSPLLEHLPSAGAYAVIFMRREPAALVRSQERMLAGSSSEQAGQPAGETIRLYEEHLGEVRCRLERRPNVRTLELWYRAVLGDPLRAAERVAVFLRRPLGTRKMAAVVDPALCHDEGGGPPQTDTPL